MQICGLALRTRVSSGCGQCRDGMMRIGVRGQSRFVTDNGLVQGLRSGYRHCFRRSQQKGELERITWEVWVTSSYACGLHSEEQDGMPTTCAVFVCTVQHCDVMFTAQQCYAR